MDITEYDEFYKWYKANERRFRCSQMTEVQIAYSAYLHGIEQSHKHGVMQAEGSDVSEGAAVGQRSGDTGVSDGHKHNFKYTESSVRFKCSCGKYEDEYLSEASAAARD